MDAVEVDDALRPSAQVPARSPSEAGQRRSAQGGAGGVQLVEPSADEVRQRRGAGGLGPVGEGGLGFIRTLISLARDKGVSAYVGDGANCWPIVHTLDVSRLFVLAIEQAPAGAQLYGAAEDDVTTRAIAETIARRLGVPARGLPRDEVEAHFGGFAQIMSLDFPPMTSPETQARFGWHPTHPTSLEDLNDADSYATAA